MDYKKPDVAQKSFLWCYQELMHKITKAISENESKVELSIFDHMHCFRVDYVILDSL